jgi:hypothetical protein
VTWLSTISLLLFEVEELRFRESDIIKDIINTLGFLQQKRPERFVQGVCL